MGSRRASRARGRSWARWLAFILITGVLAGGFVNLRNDQVRAGHRLKETEDRIAEVETDIELYEARIARLTSRPELAARLRARKADLRRLAPGEVVRLPHPAAIAAQPQAGKD